MTQRNRSTYVIADPREILGALDCENDDLDVPDICCTQRENPGTWCPGFSRCRSASQWCLMLTLQHGSNPRFQPLPHLGVGITVSVSEPNGLVEGALSESPEYDACHS